MAAETHARDSEVKFDKELRFAKQEFMEITMEIKRRQLEETDLLKQELAVKEQVNQFMKAKSEKLVEEMTLLSKIIHSCRLHFKELEKSDFENLREQYAQFE